MVNSMVCAEVYTGNSASSLHILYISGISIVGAFGLISLCITTITINQLLCNTAETVNKIYKVLTISCILPMTICCIGDLTHLTVRFLYFPYCNVIVDSEVIFMSCNDAIYYIGNILFYVLLLLRIYNTFQIKKVIIIILSFFIILSALSSVGYIFTVIKVGNDAEKFFQFGKYILFALSICDLILNINFFGIFWYQLRKIVVDIDIQSNIYQNIANVLTKHIVLFGIAIITNQLFFLWTLATSLYDPPVNYQMFIVIIAYVVRSIEIWVNVLILWLVLNINYQRYLNCCKYLHLYIAKCCVKNNENPLKNPYQQLKL